VQAKLEIQEAKGCITELELRVEDIFRKIPTTTQGSELLVEEQIDRIAHTIDQY
jgi:hypothetical protein